MLLSIVMHDRLKLTYCDLLQFKEFKQGKGIAVNFLLPAGAKDSDIMMWPRALRAKYNFDGKDPLARFSDEELRSGNLMLS